MDDQEDQGFTLEDILREFGSGKPAAGEPEEAIPEEKPEEEKTPPAPPEAEAEPAEAEPAEEEPEEAPPADAQPTIRMDMDDTRPVDTRQLHDLMREQGEPSEEEAQEDTPAEEPEQPEQPEEAGPEPFEQGWEPEYETPMGEYVPPKPIEFRPRSRQSRLRQKLVEGPEKTYYALSELGTGRLIAAIFLCALVTALSVAALVCFQLGKVPEGRMRLLLYGQVLCMLLAALLGIYRLMDGLADLLHGRFSMDTLLLVTFLVSMADGILGMKEKQVPFCAAFCFEMTMALWAQYQRRTTHMGQMDSLRKAPDLDAIVRTDDFYEGKPGFQRTPGDLGDFMEQYDRPSGPEKTLSWYALAALAAAAGIGVAAGVLHGYAAGIHSAAAALLAGVPATAFLTNTRPEAVLEKRFHRMGIVLCGWQGVKGLSVPAAVPVSDEDLFPAGAVKLNGVKFFGSRSPDQVVAYATALISAEGGGLTPVFQQLLEERKGYHYDVSGLRSYDGGGLGGEVQGEPVLVGALGFLREMGVEVPEGTRVNQAVYAAVDGELSGVFAITYCKVYSSAAGLSTLCSYRGLTPVLTSRDFVLTESFLRSKFKVNTRRMEFPDRAVRAGLSSREPAEDAVPLALVTHSGLAPMAFSITGARSLRTACRVGTGVHMAAGILGLGIVGVLAVLGATGLLSPVNLMLYELAWAVPGFLLTEWTRSV